MALKSEEIRVLNGERHTVSFIYGSVDQLYHADCSCGWSARPSYYLDIIHEAAEIHFRCHTVLRFAYVERP